MTTGGVDVVLIRHIAIGFDRGLHAWLVRHVPFDTFWLIRLQAALDEASTRLGGRLRVASAAHSLRRLSTALQILHHFIDRCAES